MSDRKIKKLFIYIPVFVYLVLQCIPFYIIVVTSIKENSEIYLNPIGLPSVIEFDNFYNAFIQGDMLVNFKNSFLIAVFSVLITLVCSTLASFAISRPDFKFSKHFYILFLSGLMFPSVAIVQVFSIMKELGLLNNIFSVVLIRTSMGLSFSIFLLVGFFKSIPRELQEAAAIDGCNGFKTLLKILVPLSKPINISIAIFVFVNAWNDFFWPLILLNKPNVKTLTLGLFKFSSQHSTDYSLTFAAVIVMSLPILIIYVYAQKYFIEGMAVGAVKG